MAAQKKNPHTTRAVRNSHPQPVVATTIAQTAVAAIHGLGIRRMALMRDAGIATTALRLNPAATSVTDSPGSPVPSTTA